MHAPPLRPATAPIQLTVNPPTGCFYWTAKRRSSRRLAVASHAFLGELLFSARLLLAPPQIFAQGLGQALLALRSFGALLCTWP
jgi:hypothetical protein